MKTIFSEKMPYVMVESISQQDQGYFGNKQLSFKISVISEGIQVDRTERNFKWLTEMMTLEFPFAIHPPMVITADKSLDEMALR